MAVTHICIKICTGCLTEWRYSGPGLLTITGILGGVVSGGGGGMWGWCSSGGSVQGVIEGRAGVRGRGGGRVRRKEL